MALAWAGSFTVPNGISIGSGSGAVSVNNSGLVAETRFQAYTSRDISTIKEVTYTADFGANIMSGLSLREFGVKTSGGTLFNREGFSAVTFDGTTELQIQVTFQHF